MTTNEFVCFTDLGYNGEFCAGAEAAPRRGEPGAPQRHSGAWARRRRPSAPTLRRRRWGWRRAPGLRAGDRGRARNIEAARRATREENAPFLTAVLEGRYTDGYLEREGANAPHVEPGDMKAIGSPLGFCGPECLHATYVRADGSAQGYTLRGRSSFSALPRNRTPSCRFVVCRAIRHTCRASVSTRNRTWIWTFGGSYAIRYTIETFSVPTWSRTRARALGEPRAIRYTIGTNHQSRRLDLHQHDAVYRTAASLFGHVGISSRSARI